MHDRFAGRLIIAGVEPIHVSAPTQHGHAALCRWWCCITVVRRVKFSDVPIGVCVCYLQLIHGIPLKLRALRRFLTSYPDFRNRIVLVQVGVGDFESTIDTENPLTTIQSMVNELNDEYVACRVSVSFLPLCVLVWLVVVVAFCMFGL